MGEAALVFPPNSAAPSTIADGASPCALAERVALARTPCFWPALPGKTSLSRIERAGLFRLADSIPGSCGDEKMVALMEAIRHAPAGDVVEIGSGCGRTAALLVWLARRYRIGAVLCLDNWDDEAMADFEIDLAPLAEGSLNYLRGDMAAASYGPDFVVTTGTFGQTRYEGRISMLHVDSGETDIAAWAPRVAPAGWIIVEKSAPGMGAAIGAFAEANRSRVAASFDADTAFFVQLKR